MTPQQKADYEAWYDEQIRLGLEDIEAGRVYSHEEVKQHVNALFAQLAEEDAQARNGKAA